MEILNVHDDMGSYATGNSLVEIQRFLAQA